MGWCPECGDELDQELFDAMAEFLGQLLRQGDKLAEEFGLPIFAIKALHRLGTSVTMKELGRQLHCDPSFVTMIADTLEERGLARREPNPADRRLKNLVLTSRGLELKRKVERALAGQMPWSGALEREEREHLLRLMRKMTGAAAARPAGTAPAGEAGEVSGTGQAASLAVS
ncbi:MAG: MarR family transcriptional regulator [Actinobacteria bacterium]|nr:MarR family transcriptional regulator [Actinomycetota bacterium]MBO0787764.1 MarR family transcriptional regulator [Actinomycetota bacterium]